MWERRLSSGDRLHLRRVGRLACGDTGDNHAIDEKELGGLGCFDEADVGRERVGGMLLLDIGENANAVRADGPAVAKQTACARLDEPLVRHMSEHKALDTHEAGAARQGDRHGGLIGSCEHLNPEGQSGGTLHPETDHRERGDYLGADIALEIRAIECVLENETVESR